MYPKLIHLYGPLSINSYGVMIALGFIVFCALFLVHPKRKMLISTATFADMVFWALLIGIIGGRMLYVFEYSEEFSTNWCSIVYPWKEGFSLIGTIVSLIIFSPLYLWRHTVPIFPTLDLIAVHIPLLQSIARIGCFLAGCCYGTFASPSLPWAVTYANPECLAPLGVALHPTQLYSSFFSLLIFLLLYFGLQRCLQKSGQLFFAYLFLASALRFGIDFWRGERSEPVAIFGQNIGISIYQVLAFALSLVAIFGLWWRSKVEAKEQK